MANAAGAFIGTHLLGLSGAAATSAGLAMLGGGSLASGGLGIGGGILLVQQASHLAARQGYRIATSLASASAAAFMSELAKLDLCAERAVIDRGNLVCHLQNMYTDFDTEINVASGNEPSASKNLTASRRALEYEIRHLTAPGWKRLAMTVARTSGAPAVAKVLDRF